MFTLERSICFSTIGLGLMLGGCAGPIDEPDPSPGEAKEQVAPPADPSQAQAGDENVATSSSELGWGGGLGWGAGWGAFPIGAGFAYGAAVPFGWGGGWGAGWGAGWGGGWGGWGWGGGVSTAAVATSSTVAVGGPFLGAGWGGGAWGGCGFGFGCGW
ncbi:MAG: hypothetical protein KF819_28240 [Labilithrix sp.]|nr:hypothetical protein [Labilithrix sp.]